MLSWIFRNVLIRGFESGLKGRRTYSYWRDLERSQWLNRDAVERLQLEALRRLLAHAETSCPFYRETWRAAGLRAELLDQASDFLRWPLIDRDVIRRHRFSMRSESGGLKLISKATGGSTGEPLQFDLDANSYERRMAAWHRGYGWAGAAPGTKQFYLWGTALGYQPPRQRLKAHLYSGLYRHVVASSFLLSEATVPRFLARLNNTRPDVVVAYTNPLYEFARLVREQGLRPHSPRAIVVGAESLFAFQRELIEDVFQAPVFETYGSREFMLMAAECDQHRGLHITAEQLRVEVLDDAGHPVPPGTEGNVAVTDLYNYGMPFIRYLNGDRAVAAVEPCPCGRGLPVLQRVAGRRLDILTTPDGRRIPGEFFPHMLKDFTSVRRFQVVQERPDEMRLRLVLAPGRPTELTAIEEQVRAFTGPSVRLTICLEEDIPLSPSGKQQVVVNRTGAR